MSLHLITLFAKEISKRKEIKFEDLLLYSSKELIKLIDENMIINNIEERKKGFISYYVAKTNSGKHYFGDDANKLVTKYSNIEVDKSLKEFKGVVVSTGKVKGRVKILSSSRHFDYFKDDEILVTPMTSPEFISAIRRAKAIITDEGGMTCHAAIVSRELKKPCIVGTKIATRILKDGDLVEVDADKGIVKIIN